MVPTVRFTLRMGSVSSTRLPYSIASRQAGMIVVWSRARACPGLAGRRREVGGEGLRDLRGAVGALAELGVLRGDSDRAGIEMADPHHDAAHDDERSRGEPELLGSARRHGLHHDAGLP